MRALKFALVFFALIVAGGVAYTAFYFHSCLGRMQACYASFRSATSGVDRAKQERFASIHAGFTASENLVAFPVPLENGSYGIILVSPENGHAKLIATNGYSHWAPQLSADGERLIFARGDSGGERELVTCDIRSWHCSILFRTRRPLRTPFDIGNGYVLFATDKPREGDSARSGGFDIFAVRRGEQPKQLTDYGMYNLQSLSVSNNKIMLGMYGQRGGFNPNSCFSGPECDKSDIYTLSFDQQQMKIHYKPDLLKPLFTVAGYSTQPVISPDGKRVAFKNTNRQGNPWRYNTAISDLSGVVDGGVPVQGYAFSTSAFAGNWLFVNEVFEDHYRVLRIDLTSKKVDGFRVEHSPDCLKSVEPVTLSIDGLASAL